MSSPFPGDVEVTIGDARLVCRSYQITNKINDVSVATIRFNKNDFQQLGAVNYLDDVVIESVSAEERIFAGNIVTVQSEPNDQIVITIINDVRLLETRLKLFVRQFSPQEVAYSSARLAGFAPDHLRIWGLDNAVKEITAFIPFKGLVVEQDEKIGEVQLLTLKSLQEQVPEALGGEEWKDFLNADGWIAFQFSAAHFAEAEIIATNKADVFLTAYNGLMQYAYSDFDGEFIEWERDRETINVKRQSHILLIMMPQRTIWLRDLSSYKPPLPSLKPKIALDIGAIMEASENFQLPLLI